MTRTISSILLVFLAGMCLMDTTGCSGNNLQTDDVGSSDTDRHEDHGEHGAGVVLDLNADDLAEFGVELRVAGPGILNVELNLPGEVVMNPDRIAHVVARTPGIAQEVFKTTGDSVATGEPLAVLESAQLAEAKAAYLSRQREHILAQTDLRRAETIFTNTEKLLNLLESMPGLDSLRESADVDLGKNRNALISAYAELKATEATFHREKTLFDKEISSEAEFLKAESDLKKAEAAFLSIRDDLAFNNGRTLDLRQREEKVAEIGLRAADRKLHALGLTEAEVGQIADESDESLARYVIRAPMDGIVVERHVVRGELLDQETEAFTIADLATVWVNLTVYQKDLATVRSGQQVEIVASHDIARATGTIAYVSPVLDEATRTTTARIVLPNEDGQWRPGVFVTGRVTTDQIDAPVVVPKTAIQTVDGESIVFIQDEDGFEPRDVQVGRSGKNNVEIVSGLAPGDRYVAIGGFVLKAEMNKASFEHAGHAH